MSHADVIEDNYDNEDADMGAAQEEVGIVHEETEDEVLTITFAQLRQSSKS